MPPKPQSKTYSIIKGLAKAGPFSYLLSPVFLMFYLTLLNSSFPSRSLPTTCRGAILLLVKPCFSVYSLYLTKHTTSAISTAAFQQIITSPPSLGTPHNDALIDVVSGIPQPGSTVVMSHNQGSTDLHGVFVNRRLALLLYSRRSTRRGRRSGYFSFAAQLAQQLIEAFEIYYERNKRKVRG